MFYSNQILTSTQYGVSTIWLLATVGKANQKRVTKRAIQDVNVPRACEKILDPGAPLALRLQGNLLYGVSRVFADQCSYVLSDAEKTQSDMKTFFQALQSSNLDLPEVKTKRVSITLPDDPNFDPTSQLPPLDLNIIDTNWLTVPSQGSASKYSQMTPLQAYASRHSSLNRQGALINLELPPSSHSAGSYGAPFHWGQSSSSQPKAPGNFGNIDNMPEFIPFQEDNFDPLSGIGLEFDGEGNLINAPEEELELPPFFGDMPSNVAMPASGTKQVQPLDEYLMMGEEQILPHAEAFPAPASVKKPQVASEGGETATTTTTETVQAAVPLKSRRFPKPVSMVDDEICLPRRQLKEQAENYADNMIEAKKRHRGTRPGQAKRNALSFVLDNGIANVGVHSRVSGLAHPLANQFSGWNVLAQLQPETYASFGAETPRHARRRKSEEAFEDDEVLTPQRNVKARHGNDAAEVGRGQTEDDNLLPIPDQDDTPFEMGMDAMPPMEDHHSSSLMPWSRQGSAVPSSSIRAPGSGHKSIGQPAPSPLLHKSTNLLPGFNRLDDPVEAPAADLASLPDDASIGSGPILHLARDAHAGLDSASEEFLDYAARRAVANGGFSAPDGEPDNGHCWVDFEQIANPQKHSGPVAAQAFLHILSLATRGVIAVRQDNNEEGTKPFGTLRVGIGLSMDEES